jgi:hypothetical protein
MTASESPKLCSNPPGQKRQLTLPNIPEQAFLLSYCPYERADGMIDGLKHHEPQPEKTGECEDSSFNGDLKQIIMRMSAAGKFKIAIGNPIGVNNF